MIVEILNPDNYQTSLFALPTFLTASIMLARSHSRTPLTRRYFFLRHGHDGGALAVELFDDVLRAQWSYSADLPHLFTDQDKLKHVLQNLINNALKFTEEGLITVTARYLADQDQVEPMVTDTGVAIPPADLPLIFDRFRQIDSTRTRSHGGAGLGLHIVKTVTELLNGRILVTSKPGRGSSFTIVLPCVGEQNDAANLSGGR